MQSPASQSLVKYDNAVLVSTTKGKGKGKKGAGGAAGGGGGKTLPPVEAKQGVTQTEDILNSILPPR